MRQSRLFATVIVFLALAGASALAQTSGSSAVERLAERLLGYWGDPAVSRAEIYPEGLPGGMAFEIPVPDGGQLIGSVAHYERDELTHVQVVIDAPIAPEDAMDALLDGFGERGWIVAPMMPAVGFVPQQASASGQACDPGTGIFAYMTATARADGVTDLRVDVNLAAVMHNPPCNVESLVPQPYGEQAPLPALEAPAASELTPHATIQMPDQASSTAVLSFAGTAADVAAHYAGRLANAGWSLGSTRAETGYVIAEGSLVDREGSVWLGVLTVVDTAGDGSRFALSFFVTVADRG